MAINMQYCRVRNVLSAVRELNEQLHESSGLSGDEWSHIRALTEEVQQLQHLLDDTYRHRGEDDEDDEDDE